MHKQKSFPPFPPHRAAFYMGKLTDGLKGRKTCRQVSSPAGRQAGGQVGVQAGRKVGRQKGIQKGRVLHS